MGCRRGICYCCFDCCGWRSVRRALAMGEPPQSVEVKCEAAQDLAGDITNSFLPVAVDPTKTQYLLTTLQKAVMALKRGSYYRVTFEEIDAPKERTP